MVGVEVEVVVVLLLLVLSAATRLAGGDPRRSRNQKKTRHDD